MMNMFALLKDPFQNTGNELPINARMADASGEKGRRPDVHKTTMPNTQ
jgi:hypothetical protein